MSKEKILFEPDKDLVEEVAKWVENNDNPEKISAESLVRQLLQKYRLVQLAGGRLPQEGM